MRALVTSSTIVFLALGAAACAAPMRPATPLPAVPATWSSSPARGIDVGGPADDRWWDAFGDDVLRDLLGRAIAGNPDLAGAAARVRAARAVAGIAEADRLPTIDARGGVTRSRPSEETVDARPGATASTRLDAGFDAAWEIDLFGRASGAATAAHQDAAAAEEDRRAALVSLRAEVARSYVSLRGDQRLRAVLVSSAAAARTTAELTRSRMTGGLASDLDVARADAQRNAVEASIPTVDASIEREMHRLSILCGEAPATLAPLLAPVAALPVAPPRVFLGTPAETLARRPDLRREALRVMAEEARAGVARADLYPRVSLAAAFGVDADAADSLTRSSARSWSIAPAVRWPLFDGGRSRNGVTESDARLDEARAAHRAALLRALGEVEDSLSNYLRGWDRRESLAASVASRRRAVEVASDVHRAGLVAFLDVLDAERSLYDAEADLARTETDTSTQLVALYKALGGGGDTGTSAD